MHLAPIRQGVHNLLENQPFIDCVCYSIYKFRQNLIIVNVTGLNFHLNLVKRQRINLSCRTSTTCLLSIYTKQRWYAKIHF